MVSHHKEVDQTVKTQHFPANKTFTGLPSNASIQTSMRNENSESEPKGADDDCIAYIPILDIVKLEISYYRTTYAMFMCMQTDLYCKCLLKQVK